MPVHHHAARRAGAIGTTALLALAAATPTGAHANDPYPSKPVRIIVPYAAGGANDTVGRLMAKGLSDQLKQSFIVDNRPGAGQVIGTEMVARSAPNGETILMGGIVHAINPGLVPKLPYDSIKDFTTVSVFATSPLVCVVPESLGIKDMQSLVNVAKADPKALSYASSGSGSPGHIAVESIKAAAKISMVHVPYKGATQPVGDMMGGLVQFYCTSPISVLPYLSAGKLRALAVTSAKRFPVLPDVPTLAEAGVPAMPIGTWYAFLVPSATDRAIVDTLNKATREVLKDPAVLEVLSKNGLTTLPGGQAESERFLKEESDKWTRFVKEAKITVQ
jgi:tripartite-type tricarboxylate transporter receptor subunit TctC